MANRSSFLSQGDNLFRSVLHSVGHGEFQTRFLQDLTSLLDVGSLEPDHYRNFKTQRFGGFHYSAGDDIATHNAAKDVNQNSTHVFIGQQNLKGVLYLLGIGAPPDIQEVGGTSSGQFDDIHGRHSQTRAIDHAADAPIQTDVVDPVTRGLDFERIFLVVIP